MAPSSNKSAGKGKKATSIRSTRTQREGTVSSEDQSPVPGTATYSIGDDGNMKPEPKSPRRRRRFSPGRREEVASVRKVGACEYCRKKKITCRHALAKLRSTSPAYSTISQANLDKFESSFQDLVSDDSLRAPFYQDMTRSRSLPSGLELLELETSDALLRNIATPATQSDRIALDIHDFDTMFGDFSTKPQVETSPAFPDWTAIYGSEPEPQTSISSSRSDNTFFSVLSAVSSPASEGDSMRTFRNAPAAFHCYIEGCDWQHGFAHEIDLRRHQESRHPDICPPTITFTCPVEGCRHRVWPFVSKDKLMEHVRYNHSDTLHTAQSTDKLSEYLNSQLITGLNENLTVFPARNAVPGENPPFLWTNGRTTTSSRGRGGIQRRRSHNGVSPTARNTAAAVARRMQVVPAWDNSSQSSQQNMTPAYSMSSAEMSVPVYDNIAIPFGNVSLGEQMYGIPVTSAELDAYTQSMTMPTQNSSTFQGFVDPTTFSTSYQPAATAARPRGPSITVRAPTFEFEQQIPQSGSFATPSTMSQAPIPSTFSPTANFFRQPNQNMIRQQQPSLSVYTNMPETQTFSDNGSSWRQPGHPYTPSNSDNYDMVQYTPQGSSVIFSLHSEPMASTVNNVVDRRASLTAGLSQPATPAMDLSGAQSSSSDASLHTVAAEVPIGGVPSSDVGTEGFLDDKFLEEFYGGNDQDFYGLQ